MQLFKRDIKATVAILSYNPFIFPTGIEKFHTANVLILAEAFTPKTPRSVHKKDLHWQELLWHKDALTKLIVFIGKKESGSLEIIRLVCHEFADRLSILHFVSCDHDWKDKKDLLEFFKVPPDQWTHFEDCRTAYRDQQHRCNEIPAMLGVFYSYILRLE